ncbi:MAG TPA: hypothetical protein VHR66_17340 [Gemmataceae bacterium]|nr:hypothetical protein [Gemmataceae bacterium]
MAVEWRERPHDDLVLAVAVAAWQAERHVPGFFIKVVSAGATVRPERLTRW